MTALSEEVVATLKCGMWEEEEGKLGFYRNFDKRKKNCIKLNCDVRVSMKILMCIEFET